jgi:hypothetical protein
MARNQVVRASLVPTNSAPAVIEVCQWQALHWNSALALITQCAAPPQPGQRKPAGQRADHGLGTLLFHAQVLQEFRQRHAVLELDAVHHHGLLRRGMRPAYEVGRSLREPEDRC